MDSINIIRSEPGNEKPFFDVEREFIFGNDCFRPEELRQEARQIADRLLPFLENKEDEKEAINIINLFVLGKIKSFILDQAYLSPESWDDLNPVIKQVVDDIRKIIVKEVGLVIDLSKFVFVDKYLKDSENVTGLVAEIAVNADLKVVKNFTQLKGIEKKQPNRFNYYCEGLGRYQELSGQDDFPSTLTPLESFDKKNVAAIFSKKDFVIFSEAQWESKYSISELLKAIQDSLDACIYLSNNNLVLEDICSVNLGIQNNGRGLLFDIGYVCPLGQKAEGIVSKIKRDKDGKIVPSQWIPPEYFGKSVDDPIFKTEKEMTYQLGMVIQDLLFIRNLDSAKTHEALYLLCDKMSEKDPAKRLSLVDARDELSLIIKSIDSK